MPLTPGPGGCKREGQLAAEWGSRAGVLARASAFSAPPPRPSRALSQGSSALRSRGVTDAGDTEARGRRDSLLDEIERDLLDGKPTADLLRKCVVLGGRAGSTELRDWASRELKGYPDPDGLPDYRVVPAVILLNGVTMRAQINGQRIRPGALPDFTHEHIEERVHLQSGVGELEELVAHSGEAIKVSLPMAADLAAYMNHESDDPTQQITELYWSVSRSAVAGVVDQIRSALAELIGEMRAALPAGQSEPDAQQAQQAVNIVMKGFSRVNLNQVQSTGGDASVTQPAPEEPTASLLARVPKSVWGFAVGAATIVAAVYAYLTYVR